MPVPRYTVTDGIVIRRKVLPSGDVVVTLMNEQGKFRAILRKGRLPGGNHGRLSLFHDVTVQFHRKREDDLALITQVQLNGALPRLSSPTTYPYAHVLAELADALTVDVHLGERVYAYLASGLRGLHGHDDAGHVGLLYAWQLLGVAGLAPRTKACVACGSPGPLVALDVAAGGLTCEACRHGIPLPPDTVCELQAMVAAPLRAALRTPPGDRALHWRVLARYVAFHVSELRSFESVIEHDLDTAPTPALTHEVPGV